MGLMWASIDWNNPVIQTSAVNLTKLKNFSETFADIFSFHYEIFKIQFFSLITDALEGGFYNGNIDTEAAKWNPLWGRGMINQSF